MNAALTDAEIGVLLSAAVRAPSIHNTQPWRFEVHGSVLDVRLDDERSLPATDPAGRAARIAAGAAVFNVRVAAAMFGRESETAVDPDPTRPDIVARLFLSAGGSPIRPLSSLYRELPRRRTYRGPLLEQPIHERILRRLNNAADAERTLLHWLTDEDRQLLGRLVPRADADELHHEDGLHERELWIGGDRTLDGVPAGALGPVPVQPAFVRDLSAGFGSDVRSRIRYETNPAIAVLSTPEDDSAAWVQAGTALQRVLLVATSYGLTASFLNQVLEHGETRHEARNLVADGSWPQMILRIGYPAVPADRTGRRDWRESYDQWF